MLVEDVDQDDMFGTSTNPFGISPIAETSPDDDVDDINFDFDDDDNEYGIVGHKNNMSLFTNHHKALTTIDNTELLRRKLEESKTTKNPELKLNGKFIDHLPEELKTFTWVLTLTLETTDIKEITDCLPPNLVKFVCRFNVIRIFDGSVLPASVLSLVYQNNQTHEIVGLQDGLLEVDVSNNILKGISCKFPQNMVKLVVTNNKMFTLDQDLPDSTLEFVANDTAIRNIDNLNDNLEKLSTCRCFIPVVNKFPAKLKEWKNFVSNTKEIKCNFPDTLTHLDMFNNQLTKCPLLHESIVDVDLSNNNLDEIPEWKNQAIKIDLKQNPKIKAEDIKTLQKEMPQANILYDSYRQTTYGSDWNSDDYYGGRYYTEPTVTNHSTYSNYSTNYWNGSTYQFPKSTYKPEFSEDDPDVVILKKTYILS